MSQQQVSPFFIRQLVEYVEQRLGHRLKTDQLAWIRNFSVEHVPQQAYLSNIQLAQAARKLGDEILRIVATHSQQREVVDVHEMLQDVLATDGYGPQHANFDVGDEAELFSEQRPSLRDEYEKKLSVDEFLGLDKFYTFSLAVQPRSIYGIKHIVLDSKNRENPGDRFSLRWNEFNLAQQGSGRYTYPGTFLDIVVLRVLAFYVPVPENLEPVQDDFNRRVFMQIEEFATQSFFGPNRSQFQIPLSVDVTSTIDGTRLLRVFEENRGWFRAGLPVTRLDTITIKFYALSTLLEIPPERQTCTIEWLPVLPTVFQFVIPELSLAPGTPYVLAVGDIVQFENYQAPAGLSSYFTNWITDVGGHAITAVIDNQTYQAAGPNTSPPDPPGFPPPYTNPVPITAAECIIVKRLITIPMQVIYRRPEEEMELESSMARAS